MELLLCIRILMTIIPKLGTTVLTNIYTPLDGENSWKSHVLVKIIVTNMYIGDNIFFLFSQMANIAINMYIIDNQYCC